MISSSYNNGVSQTRAYNSDNTLASITHAGAAIGSYTYNWDSNKNKTAEAVSGGLSGFGFTVPASGYDGEDRLTAWNRSDNALSKAWNLSLVGDWNSVTENSQTQARTHGPTHELLSAAGQLIEHDVKGNTTKIPAILRTTDVANPQPDLNLSWDFDNRMRSASDGAATVSYSFDALGRRVARTDSATTVVYVQNGQQTVADYPLGAAAPSPTSTYVYASYIDEPVMRTGTGGDRYYHRGQQYSIIALTGGGGTVTERYAYDAYGTLTVLDASGTSLTTSAENNRYTYTGREYDEALGLYHYRARMYDSVAGRFCSRDPAGFVDGLNLFRFYLGLDRVDPTGMFTGECHRIQSKVDVSLPKLFEDGPPNAGCGISVKFGGKAEIDIHHEKCQVGCCESASDGINWRVRTRARVRVGLAATVTLGCFVSSKQGPLSVEGYVGLKGELWGHFSGEGSVEYETCNDSPVKFTVCAAGKVRGRYSGGAMLKFKLWNRWSLDTGAQVYAQRTDQCRNCWHFGADGSYLGSDGWSCGWGKWAGHVEGCSFGKCARFQIF